MSKHFETQREFWSRIALEEFTIAMMWRRMKRYAEARHSIALVREWKEIAGSN